MKQIISELDISADGHATQAVKVYFGERDQRFPQILRFVRFKDYKDLSKKGMVRAVSQNKFDAWDSNPNIGLTKIFVVKDFSYIKPL